eukprot:6203314-Pleurochrysis_carterae.AAC.3
MYGALGAGGRQAKVTPASGTVPRRWQEIHCPALAVSASESVGTLGGVPRLPSARGTAARLAGISPGSAGCPAVAGGAEAAGGLGETTGVTAAEAAAEAIADEAREGALPVGGAAAANEAGTEEVTAGEKEGEAAGASAGAVVWAAAGTAAGAAAGFKAGVSTRVAAVAAAGAAIERLASGEGEGLASSFQSMRPSAPKETPPRAFKCVRIAATSLTGLHARAPHTAARMLTRRASRLLSVGDDVT